MHATAASQPAPAAGASRRFAVPASPALEVTVAALRRAAGEGGEVRPLAEQRAAAQAVGDAWVVSILDGFVLALAAAARGPGAGRRTAAAVRDLADRVVGAGARRASPERITAFLELLDARLEAGPSIGFDVDDGLADALAPVLAAHGGAGPSPAALSRALHATTDAALRHLLDEPVDVLGLGALTRAATRVGRAAIAGRVHAEIDRAVHDPAAARRLAELVAGFVAPRPAAVRSGG